MMNTSSTQPAETEFAPRSSGDVAEAEPAAPEPVEAAETVAKTVAGLAPLCGEAQEGESTQAIIACNEWLCLGPGRSFSRLIELYEARTAVMDSGETRPAPAKTDRNRPKNGTLAPLWSVRLRSVRRIVAWHGKGMVGALRLERARYFL